LFNNDDTSLLGTIPNGINNNGVDTPNYTPGSLELNRNPRNGEPAFNAARFSFPALGRPRGGSSTVPESRTST